MPTAGAFWLPAAPVGAAPLRGRGGFKGALRGCARAQASRTSEREAHAERLDEGTWVKVIAGASCEDAAAVRNLAAVYTLAGVDCVDVAADEAVCRAANDGIDAAVEIANDQIDRPWLMVSVNDDDDPHFRKASVDARQCPSDCPQPCVRVCPADAVVTTSQSGGVHILDAKCYGCGRCLPACPHGLIDAVQYRRSAAETARLIRSGAADALEIHTSGAEGGAAMQRLWDDLSRADGETTPLPLRLLAVSLPGSALPLLAQLDASLTGDASIPVADATHRLWQLDGRPMTGDVGHGVAHDAVSLARRATLGQDVIPRGHHVQLAGGTNDATRRLVDSHPGLLARLGGVAFGGYARKAVRDALSSSAATRIEDDPAALEEAVACARRAVDAWRCAV